jgi:hypothetical protein
VASNSKFRHLDTACLAAAKAEFQKMLKAGVMRRSSSSWASPQHMVRKNDGGWWPCGNFCLLNMQTTDDKYPLPIMGDLSGRLDGCTIFTKLDLEKGYFQVPVAPADVPKTAVITPFTLFKFVWTPYGLKNTGMMFQRYTVKSPNAQSPNDLSPNALFAKRNCSEYRKHPNDIFVRTIFVQHPCSERKISPKVAKIIYIITNSSQHCSGAVSF